MTESAPPPRRILLVDDHAPLLSTLARFLRGEGYRVLTAESGEEALEKLATTSVDLALVDMLLPGMNGMELLPHLVRDHQLPVILMTGYAEAEIALQAVRLGAYEFLTKPVVPEILPVMIENALDHRRLEKKEREAGGDPEPSAVFGSLIGVSPPMQKVFQAIGQVAGTDAPVLISGETGTGKNLVAREIHSRSPRHTGPFLQLNCAAIPEQLFESELFGHEEGAFTDAKRRHQGRFERAAGGTLLLDEVACLPLNLQAKLLRVLEEGEFERVGGQRTHQTNVRILAATNLDLTELVAQGRFREDLFYRLATFPIYLPPLRERCEDIPLLLRRFLDDQADGGRVDIPGVSGEAIEEACQHPWKGNIRELANAVSHAVISQQGGRITSLLPPVQLQIPTSPCAERPVQARPLPPEPAPGELPFLEDLLASSLQDATTSFQSYYLGKLMERFEGKRHRLAEHAGISTRTLLRYLKRLELD